MRLSGISADRPIRHPGFFGVRRVDALKCEVRFLGRIVRYLLFCHTFTTFFAAVNKVVLVPRNALLIEVSVVKGGLEPGKMFHVKHSGSFPHPAMSPEFPVSHAPNLYRGEPKAMNGGAKGPQIEEVPLDLFAGYWTGFGSSGYALTPSAWSCAGVGAVVFGTGQRFTIA